MSLGDSEVSVSGAQGGGKTRVWQVALADEEGSPVT
jgi:hypothetical protein